LVTTFVPAARGLDPERATLQQIGQTLLDELGAKGFCQAALRSAGGFPGETPLIWDGIRHVRVLDALIALYCESLRFVYLDPPRAERLKRLGVSEHVLATIEQDRTETDGELLRGRADLISGELETRMVLGRVMSLLELAA